MTSRRKK